MGVPFVCIDNNNEDFSNVQMIICLPPSPPTIVGHSVDYVLQEGGEKLYRFVWKDSSYYLGLEEG